MISLSITTIIHTLTENHNSKAYTNEEMVRKRLQCLPISKWGPKVTTIEEVEETLKVDDLFKKLLTNEIHLQEEIEEPTPQQGLTLKFNDIEMQPNKLENDEDESLAMIDK